MFLAIMSYELLMYIHLATILPAFLIGTVLLIIKKGTSLHKQLGRIYMVLMLFTGVLTLFMPAKVGAQFLGHFGWIHLLCVLTIYTVPGAYYAAKRGDIASHKRKMILLYAGAMLIAGGFTFMPGRYLYELFFG